MKMNKILFIIPPVTLEERYGSLESAGTLYPPLGIAYLASIAIKNKCDVEVIDSEAEGYNYVDIKGFIKAYKPDIVGMQTYCTNIQQCLKVAQIIKIINPDIKVLLGGAQVTLFYDKDYDNVDFIIRGEGEKVFEELISGKEVSIINGLVWKNGDGIVVNPQQELIRDLDSIPFPARHLFPIEKYHSSAQLRGNRTLNIMTSRGCPYRCIVGDTLINTVDGMIPIKDLVGNSIGVYTYNKKTGDRYIKQTINIRKVKSQAEILRVTFDDNSFIDCTPDHKFYTFKNSWKEAKNLSYGENVIALKRDNNSVIKVEFLEDKQDVYDMEVPTTHCYFANNVLIHNCAYCSGHINFGKTFRYFSKEYVINEIKDLISKYQVDSLQFYDETFTVNRKRVLELCQAMIDNKVNLPWACFTRVNLVDEELLKEMKRAGCYQIFFGTESGNQRLLDLIRKDITLEQSRKAIKLCKKVGIQTFCSFMLNIPTETIEDSWNTINFAIELNPDYVQFPITTPFPGTELYNIAKQSGKFVTEDWSKYMSWSEIVYTAEGRTVDEIQDTVKKAYRKFYLRPRYILSALNRLRKLPIKKQIGLIKQE